MTTPRYPHTALTAFGEQLLHKSGLDHAKATAVARTLVEGDMMGHDTHGLALLPGYLADIDSGAMTKTGEPLVGMPADTGLGVNTGSNPPKGATLAVLGSEQVSSITRPWSVARFR